MERRHQLKGDREVIADADRKQDELEVRPQWPGKKPLIGAQQVDARAPDLKKIRAAISALRGGGMALPGAMTREYSKLLGLDLSDVRLHRGGAANDAARSLDATAYTHGTDIAVADHLDLDSAFGRHVIAHELVHVAQHKRSGGAELSAHADVGPSGSAIEQEAERGAAALTRGMSFNVGSHARMPGISRFGNDENPPTGAATPVPVPGANPPPVDAPVRAQVPTPGSQPTQAQPAPTPAPAPATPAATPAPQPRPNNQPAQANAPGVGTPGVNAPSGSGGATNPTAPANREPRPAAAPRPAGSPTPALSLDDRVKQELETRADPTLKAGYARAVAGVDALRVQAQQFTFQPNGVWNTLVETFTAKNAFQDHFGQIYSTNAYRGGNSWADTAQSWIEGLRGVVHIIGDVASVISAWAGLAALVTGALALILSETVIGGIALGAIAAIAAEVAMVAGAIKLLTDIIDTILGVIQMIILIVRARNSKDPAARARFAQLLHKEANDFGANVVSIGVQVAVMAVSAGVGAGLSRGANSFVSSFKSEFTRMITPALKPWTLGSNIRGIANMMRPAAAGSGVKTMTGTNLRGQTVPRTVLNAETEAGIVAIQRNVRGPRGRMTTAKEIVAFTPANQMKGARLVLMRRALISSLIVNTGGFKIGLGASQLQADIKQPRASVGGTSGSSPSANGGRLDVPQSAGSDLSKVQMWPSQIELFENAKGPIQGTTDRTQRQYEMAEAQAGPELAAQVRTAFQGANNSAGQMRFGAMAVQTDAQEGQANTQRGLQQTQQAGQQQGQMAVQQNRANTSVQRISNEGAKLQSPPPKEGVLGWLYNQTIGRIGGWIGSAQKWVMNLVGKWAMSLAGFSKEEMDIAGIENDMREDDKKDATSTQEAQDAALKADQIQQTVFQLQENKTRDEQYAIQGMADAQRFIQALEDADRQLAAAITNGQSYIGQVSPLIAHELQTEEQQASIDAAYIAPATGAVQAFTDSIDNANVGDATQQQGNAALNQLKAAFPELDITQGTSAITTATQSYTTAFGVLAGSARTQAAAITTALQAFIGTQDYDGVSANAAALEALAADFDRQATELQNQLVAAVQGVVDQYVTHVMNAITQAQQIPDDPDTANDNQPAVQRKALTNATAPQQMAQTAGAEAKGPESVPTDINNPAPVAPPVPANAADNANATTPAAASEATTASASGAQVPGAAPNGATASTPKDGLIGGASNTTEAPASSKNKPPTATPKQQANPAGADKAPVESENEAEQSIANASAGSGAGSNGSDNASSPGPTSDKPKKRDVAETPEPTAAPKSHPAAAATAPAEAKKADKTARKLGEEVSAEQPSTEDAAVEGEQGPAPVQGEEIEEEEEDVVVQRRSLSAAVPTGSPGAIAMQATAGSGSTLPHLDAIQQSFGSHDVSGIRAHTGGKAEAGAAALNARAFAVGDSVAFGGSPDLHTAAHEAAHVVQQRAGLRPAGGIDGGSSDALEQHADEVADAVVAGRSAQPILDRVVGSKSSVTTGSLGLSTQANGESTQPMSSSGTAVTKQGPSVTSSSPTTVTKKKSTTKAASKLDDPKAEKAAAPEAAAEQKPAVEKPEAKEAAPVQAPKPAVAAPPEGFAALAGAPPEQLGKKLTQIHTASTAETSKQRAAQQANPPKQMSTGEVAEKKEPDAKKDPKEPEAKKDAKPADPAAAKAPITAAAPEGEATKQAKQGAAVQQQTQGQQLVATIAQSISSWFGSWTSLFGGGGGKDKMSKDESANIASSVDNLSTKPSMPPADPNNPQVAEKAKADASAQRDRAAFDTKAAAAQKQGLADAAVPMGEDSIKTSVLTEELSAKIAEGAAVPPPVTLPTLANSGATEEVGIVAREEQGAEIDAALAKANADVAVERSKQSEKETAARAEADASLKQIKAQSEAEQAQARAAAKTEVDGARAQWKAEVDKKGAEARAQADKKVAEGMAQIDAEEQKANAEAKRHITEGQQKATEEQQKGEAEAEAAKERGKSESKGFFGWLARKAKAAFEGIKRAVSAALDAARAAVKAVIDGAKKLAMAAIDLARKAINVAIKLIGDALLAITDVLLAAFPELKAKFQAAIKTAVDAATAAVNRLADGLKKAVQAALDLLGSALDAVLKAYETAINFIVDAAAVVVDTAIKAAQAVVDKLAQWATIIKDVASGPIAWIGKLGAAAIDGVKNHLWGALKTAVVEWFTSKVFEILGVGGIILQMLFDGGMSQKDIVDMALEALMTAIPMALAAVLIEQVIAMIVPAAGAVMAIIRGLQAAWGTVSRILAAFEAFITFLQMVQSGQAGPQFAQLVALSAVVVLDFVSNYLLAKIMGPAKKVGDKLKGIAAKFGKGKGKGVKAPKTKAPSTKAGVQAKAPKGDKAAKPTTTKPKKADAKPKTDPKKQQGQDKKKEDAQSKDQRAAKRAATEGAKRVWSSAKSSGKAMSSGELQSLMLKAKSSGKARVQAKLQESGEGWSVHADATVGKTTATATAGRGWVAKSESGQPFYAAKNLLAFNKKLIKSSFAALGKQDGKGKKEKAGGKQAKNLRTSYDTLVAKATKVQQSKQQSLDSQMRGLKVAIEIEPFTAVEKDKAAKTKISVSPNTQADTEDIELDFDKFPYKLGAAGSDKATTNIQVFATSDHYGAPKRPAIAAPSEKISGLVVNMISTPKDVKPDVASKYVDKAWAGDDDKHHGDRTGVVLGINAMRSISDTQTTKNRGDVNGKMGVDRMPGEGSLRVAGFTWDPHWVDREGKTVTFDQVRGEFEKFEGDKEALRAEREKLGQSTIPYGALRGEVLDRSKPVVQHLRKAWDPVYVVSQDSDGGVTTQSGKGVLAAYAEVIKQANTDKRILIGGYTFEEFTSPDPRTQQLTRFADKINRAIQGVLAEMLPDALYPTEVNMAILASASDGRGVMDGAAEGTERNLFGKGHLEGKAAVDNVVGSTPGQVGTVPGGAIQTELRGASRGFTRTSEDVVGHISGSKGEAAVAKRVEQRAARRAKQTPPTKQNEQQRRQAAVRARETEERELAQDADILAKSKLHGSVLTSQSQSFADDGVLGPQMQRGLARSEGVDEKQFGQHRDVSTFVSEAVRVLSRPGLTDEAKLREITAIGVRINQTIDEKKVAEMRRTKHPKVEAALERLRAIVHAIVKAIDAPALAGEWHQVRELLGTIETEHKTTGAKKS